MNKSDLLAKAIVDDMEYLMQRYRHILNSDEDKNEIYDLVKVFYDECSEEEKQILLRFVDGIVSDSFSLLLSGLCGEGGNILKCCGEIEILCDKEVVDPWLTDIVMEIVQDTMGK